jgi:hypothetical protein
MQLRRAFPRKRFVKRCTSRFYGNASVPASLQFARPGCVRVRFAVMPHRLAGRDESGHDRENTRLRD